MRLNKKDIQSIVRVAKEIYEKRGKWETST